MGKHGFYNRGKSENFESNFWPEKIYQYGFTVYQKMENSNIEGGGVCFLRNVEFFNIFMRKSRF